MKNFVILNEQIVKEFYNIGNLIPVSVGMRSEISAKFKRKIFMPFYVLRSNETKRNEFVVVTLSYGRTFYGVRLYVRICKGEQNPTESGRVWTCIEKRKEHLISFYRIVRLCFIRESLFYFPDNI